ncbi:metallophosphoesterase [Propionibacteriaceae bacterium Y2011]|uniref:metallophosphoesterase n=1 Tax=Microlunatus sp. Y2014 TaxID=3418488 RepID=UPI003B493EB1
MGVAKRVGGAVAVLGALGAGSLGYAMLEARAFTVRRVKVPVLPPGSRPIRVLHLSDFHLTPGQRTKQEFIASLAALEPDLVVNTGDNHADGRAWPYVVRSLGRLLDVPGVFVHGSNDYYAPKRRNWLAYLDRHTGGATEPTDPRRDLPWRQLDAEFTARGWHDLTEREVAIDVAGQRIALRGTDDAHLDRDDYAAVAGPFPDDATLRIGVTHAPYLRVLNGMAADGADLIMAGHTHGGQVCVPGYGALVTNCDLDTGRVKGLSSHRASGRTAHLHVSAGLGTSPYAPIRFACRPEVSLLKLVPR